MGFALFLQKVYCWGSGWMERRLRPRGAARCMLHRMVGGTFTVNEDCASDCALTGRVQCIEGDTNCPTIKHGVTAWISHTTIMLMVDAWRARWYVAWLLFNARMSTQHHDQHHYANDLLFVEVCHGVEGSVIVAGDYKKRLENRSRKRYLGVSDMRCPTFIAFKELQYN